MKRLTLLLLLLFGFNLTVQSQVTTDPEFPNEDQSVTITFDATEGNGGLANHNGDVYAHTGVITDQSTSNSDWKYVVAKWDENISKAKLQRDPNNSNIYTLDISPSIREYYGVPEGETIEKLAFVFRNSDGSKEGKADGEADIFADVYQNQFNIKFTKPTDDPIFREVSGQLDIEGIGSTNTGSVELSLLINGNQVQSVSNDTIRYTYQAQTEGKFEIALAGYNGSERDTLYKTLVVYPQPTDQDRPAGLEDGITYVDDNTVRLSLFAPNKEFAYLIGDFNDWEVQPQYFMNRDEVNADSSYFWIEIDGLSPGQEYGFQYFIDGEIKIADPYSEKVLDPYNDQYIENTTYPNLKAYPQDKTDQFVGVFEPGKPAYNWQHQNYDRPKKENLVIYELHIRDFVESHDFKTITDTLDYLDGLGVNALELMPVMEFEGNNSWGYNPAFLLATDKYYGPADDLKAFIDEAHSRGIAVILDIVLNHVYGQSPLVRLWNQGTYGQPTSENPYLNIESPNQTYSWGYDFNHESHATQYYVDRVTRYWLEEFKADGYRFDFTKGFTQNPGDGWQRDEDRIRLLKRMADQQWAVDDSSYVILEHLTENSEEQELANYGILLWGNMHYNYKEGSLGYHDDGKSNFSGVYHKSRGWNNPNLVGYMESHDEERIMVENLNYGNSNTDNSYDVTELSTALDRIKLSAAFFFTVPGPKMFWQFGELGYDVGINQNGRTGEKPIKWEYHSDPERKKLYDTYKALIKLRNAHAAFTSSDSQVTMDVADAVKRITIDHPEMKVSIVGNFGVDSSDVQPQFSQDGSWYDYFSGDTLSVSDSNTTLSMQAGEFHIYTTQKFETPAGNPVSFGEGNTPDNGGNGGQTEEEFTLYQNYPNPFNPSTTIPYDLPSAMNVRLQVYNILGQRVINRNLGEQSAGEDKEIQVDFTDLSSGIYIYRLQAGSNVSTKKMMLIK